MEVLYNKVNNFELLDVDKNISVIFLKYLDPNLPIHSIINIYSPNCQFKLFKNNETAYVNLFNNFYQENSNSPTTYYEIELYNSYPLNYSKNKCILYINNILDLNNELKEINEPSADLIIIENTPQIFRFKNINDTIKLKYPNVNKDKSLMINIRLINVDEYRIYFYENLKKIIKK